MPVNARGSAEPLGLKTLSYWRSVAAEMSPVIDEPTSANGLFFSPLFSLFQIFDWAAQFDDEPSRCQGVNDAVLTLARHCKALLSAETLRNDKLWQRWELEVAHGFRLSFLAHHLARVRTWRLQEEDESNSWPDKLPDDITPTIPLVASYDGEPAFLIGFTLVGPLADSRVRLPDELSGRLLKSENHALTEGLECRDFFDSSLQTVPLKPNGDVLVFGGTNPGFDVAIPVMLTDADGKNKRPGLVLPECKTAAAGVKNPQKLDKEVLKAKVEVLTKGDGPSKSRKNYRQTLLNADKEASATPLNWLADHNVEEKDVVLMMAGHCDCEVNDVEVRKVLANAGAQFSVAYAGISTIPNFFGTSLSRRARIRMGDTRGPTEYSLADEDDDTSAE